MASVSWKRILATVAGVLAIPCIGFADDLILEGKWLDRFNELKEAGQQEFLQSVPKPGENIEFVTKNNVRQHGQLVRLEADRFVVNIHGKELTYRESFLSPESAAEFLAGPYAEAQARAKIETEMEEERRIQAEAEAAAERERAAQAEREEKKKKFLEGVKLLADSEASGSDLLGFYVLGGTLQGLQDLPEAPQKISEEEASAKELLWQAFTKMSSATELGVTKIRYGELLVDLKTTFKVQQRKLAANRFCKFRVQCILALACYIKASEAWDEYFKRRGSDKKILVGEMEIDALKALGTDVDLVSFQISQTDYAFYNVPYDLMLSLYWHSATKLVDGMLE